jgi:putative FmdB family regulatory protein
MPIYAYKCESCGHAKDVLQKISDAPLTVCPQCGAPAFKKQVTAAGFQLKGSGWYVTDFRGGNSTGVPAPKVDGGDAGNGGDSKPADSGAAAPAGTAAPASPAPAPAAAPAKASGDSSSKSSS